MANRRGHIRISNAFIDERLRWLSNPALRVLMVLLSYRNNGTGKCFPKESDIARLTGYSERYIRDGIRELIALDLITVKREHWQSGKWKHNEYELTVP